MGMPNAFCTDAGTCSCAPADCASIGECGEGIQIGCGSYINCPCAEAPPAPTVTPEPAPTAIPQEEPITCLGDNDRCDPAVDVCCGAGMACLQNNGNGQFRCRAI